MTVPVTMTREQQEAWHHLTVNRRFLSEEDVKRLERVLFGRKTS